MSSANYQIQEHIVPAQHVRELPNALAVNEQSQDAFLQLSVKQYIPRNNQQPKQGDLTIVAFHASGHNKELYEPLWDDLLRALPSHVGIRGIWMADMAQHGASYALNEHKLAEGICWDDHARDVLHMVNTFRDQMQPPLIGIGHSMGASQLLQLCHIHPRLFASVAFLDPWLSMQSKAQHPNSLWKKSFARNESFDSLEAAREAYRNSLPFKLWDERCFDRYLATAMRPTPTLLEPQPSLIVPATPSFITFHSARRVHAEPIDLKAESANREDRLVYPDIVYDFPVQWPYCMPHVIDKAKYLATLRPRAFFLYGSDESVISPKYRRQNLETTGLGSGGSGGQRLGCVSDGLVKGTHFFPFDNPTETGKQLADWLAGEVTTLHAERVMLDRRFKLGSSAQVRQAFPVRFEVLEARWQKAKTSKL